MNTETRHITVGGVRISIVRKAIKNLHLGVYPPHGRVRVAAPLLVSDDAVRLAVVDKLGWIKRQRAQFDAQPRQSRREMSNGESHYFLGQRYRMRVIADEGPGRIVLRARSIHLHAHPDATVEAREALLQRWYREQLKELVPSLVKKWERRLGVRVADWRIKKMKTKWGSCTREARRIWLNLELAKKPVPCIEYIVVHEMVHLRERHHGDRFRALMDRILPRWRLQRDELNRSALGHESWPRDAHD